MKLKTIKISYIVVHGLLVIILLSFVTYLLLHRLIPETFNTGNRGRLETASSYLFPTLFHIILSFIGMIPALYLPATSRNEIERKLLPPMYLCMTLTNVPVIAQVITFNGMGMIGLTTIARIHVFAMLFTSILLLFLGLFHLGINTGKIYQFTILAALGCLLITVLVPVTVSMYPMSPGRWISDRQFFLLPLILGILAAFNYVALYLREPSYQTLFKSGSLMLIIFGHVLYQLRLNPATVWIGILLLACGIFIGIPRGRFSQLQ